MDESPLKPAPEAPNELGRPETPLNADDHSPFNGAASFPLRHRVIRAIWNITWLLMASWTPHYFRPWRILLLRMFGAKIGRRTDVRNKAKIWYPPNLQIGDNSLIGPHVNCYNMARVSIGDWVIVSQGSYLCGGSHNIDDPNFQLITRPISIENHAWIASDAFVGPGVSVGEGAVLGARGATFTNLMPWGVYVGNPASLKRMRRNIVSIKERSL